MNPVMVRSTYGPGSKTATQPFSPPFSSFLTKQQKRSSLTSLTDKTRLRSRSLLIMSDVVSQSQIRGFPITATPLYTLSVRLALLRLGSARGRPAAEVCLLSSLPSSALSAIRLPLLLLQPITQASLCCAKSCSCSNTPGKSSLKTCQDERPCLVKY